MNRLKNLAACLIVCFYLLFFIYLFLFGNLFRKDIDVNGKFSVGKYTLHKKIKKGYDDYFIFYINGVKYQNLPAGIKDEDGSYEKVGRFYKIRYSKKFKGHSIVFLDQEVTDTTEILKAGFTINDILSNENDRININESSLKQEVFAILGIKEE